MRLIFEEFGFYFLKIQKIKNCFAFQRMMVWYTEPSDMLTEAVL